MINDDNIKTILVAPHADDIAYSIGGSLILDSFVKPILMTTIFTNSNCSRHIKIKDNVTISRERILEDIEFANKLGIKYQSLHFYDAPLRGILDIYSIVDPVSDPIFQQVYVALSKLIKSYHCELIVSPMGIGNHVDHIIVRDACRKIARENNLQIIFYEDLCYAYHMTPTQITAKARAISPSIMPYDIDITSIFNEKIKNVKLYESQTDIISRIKIRLYAMRLGAENIDFRERIQPNNLLGYMSCLLVDNFSNVKLLERMWIAKDSKIMLTDEKTKLLKLQKKDTVNKGVSIKTPRWIQDLRNRVYMFCSKDRYFDIFHNIYSNNYWNSTESVSGTGSSLEQTSVIRREIPPLLKEIGAISILDAPCGDFNWMRYANIDIDRYIGADLISELITKNRQRYGSKNKEFMTLDIIKDDIPKVDVIMCRDCLVHFSFDHIISTLRNFKRSKSTYLLTTTYTDRLKNHNIVTGNWRPINLQLQPFNFPEPIKLIDEKCTEANGKYSDKSLALWNIDDIII